MLKDIGNMHTCTLSMCAHTHMHTCKHTTHRHMHTPQSGTKHQADDLTSRILLLERILKSSKPAPHVIYKVTNSLQPREGNSAKGRPLRELIAKSNCSRHTTKTISYSKNFLPGCALKRAVLFSAGSRSHLRIPP